MLDSSMFAALKELRSISNQLAFTQDMTAVELAGEEYNIKIKRIEKLREKADKEYESKVIQAHWQLVGAGISIVGGGIFKGTLAIGTSGAGSGLGQGIGSMKTAGLDLEATNLGIDAELYSAQADMVRETAQSSKKTADALARAHQAFNQIITEIARMNAQLPGKLWS